MSIFIFEGTPDANPKVIDFINWSMRPLYNIMTHFYYEGLENELFD